MGVSNGGGFGECVRNSGYVMMGGVVLDDGADGGGGDVVCDSTSRGVSFDSVFAGASSSLVGAGSASEGSAFRSFCTSPSVNPLLFRKSVFFSRLADLTFSSRRNFCAWSRVGGVDVDGCGS